MKIDLIQLKINKISFGVADISYKVEKRREFKEKNLGAWGSTKRPKMGSLNVEKTILKIRYICT